MLAEVVSGAAPPVNFVLTGGLSQSEFFQQVFQAGVQLLAPGAKVLISARKGPLRYQTAAYGALLNAMRPEDPHAATQLCPTRSAKQAAKGASDHLKYLLRRGCKGSGLSETRASSRPGFGPKKNPDPSEAGRVWGRSNQVKLGRDGSVLGGSGDVSALRWFVVFGMFVVPAGASCAESSVGPVPDEVRQQFRLAPFYAKHIDVQGMPIVGSANVSDNALREAAWIVQHMLGQRPDILQAMARNNVRLAVMAYNEYTTDLPEHSDLEPKVFWDRRARGLGATAERPAVSCAEENLLDFPDDPYATENICIHEFAHAIHEMGMPLVDATFDTRLREAYERAASRALECDLCGSRPG